MRKIGGVSLFLYCVIAMVEAQIPAPIKRLTQEPFMRGASLSLLVKDLSENKIIYSYDANRQLTPASIMKTVTTATALELLGKDFRYATSIQYDGEIVNGVLEGNLYIKGSGDPSLGSSHLPDAFDQLLNTWANGVKEAGITQITGAVIADESVFDTEGISPKWVAEDLGSYYGAGSYGLSVFDNIYRLYLRSGEAGSVPAIVRTEPEMPDMRFHNYLTAFSSASDSTLIMGPPFIAERYLYGVVPANRDSYTLKGDIPDPALLLARLVSLRLGNAGIGIDTKPSCCRIEKEQGRWKEAERKTLVTTYSPPLSELIRITNHVSHNLYADALLKTCGLAYEPAGGEVISSFGRGVRVLRNHLGSKGINLSTLHTADGSGLAREDKVSASFMVELLTYMALGSDNSGTFIASLPIAGETGSVHNFLKGSKLHGKAHLKSGGMSRVRTYVGYIDLGDKRYAVALLANDFSCDGRTIDHALAQLLISLL